jgi:hypothetical protein
VTEDRTRLPATDLDDETSPTREPLKVALSIPQIVGGALAAATAAALGSSLGVAGTVIGASVASVIGGVAGTLYSAGIDRTHRTVTAAIKRGYGRVKVADPSDAETAATSEGMPEAPDADEVEVVVAAAPKALSPRRRLWIRAGLTALAIFAVSAVVVTVIELTLGRSLDGSLGTTVSQVTRPSPRPTVTVTSVPTTDPSSQPSASATQPTAEPTSVPTPTPTAPPSSAEPTQPVPQVTSS